MTDKFFKLVCMLLLFTTIALVFFFYMTLSFVPGVDTYVVVDSRGYHASVTR